MLQALGFDGVAFHPFLLQQNGLAASKAIVWWRQNADVLVVAARSYSGKSAQKGWAPRRIGCTKGRLNARLHHATDQDGRPVALLLTDGQTSDHTGVKILYPTLPDAEAPIVDKGCDSDEFRNALNRKGIEPCIPAKSNRKMPITYDARLYRQRSKIEIMFCRLKHWRCFAMRHDDGPTSASQPSISPHS